MASPDEKKKKRIRIRSHIAKDLLTPKYKQRIVRGKRGRVYDLNAMSHSDLVEAINDV